MFKLGKTWVANLRTAPHIYRRVRLHTDKSIAQQWEAALQKALDLKAAGLPVKAESLRGIPARTLEGLALVSKLAEGRRQTWGKLAIAYIAELRTAGREDKYLAHVQRRLTQVAKVAGWRAPADADRKGWMAYAEARRAAGRSTVTINDELGAVKSFVKWCIINEFLDRDALVSVKPLPKGEKKLNRRALKPDEVARLLDKAGEQELPILVALNTGLRVSELRKLEWRDVRFDRRPCLQLRAEATKARRADMLPLPADLAARLATFRPADAKPKDRVFPHVAKFREWCRLLKLASIRYRDDRGRIAGWHSTRVTFITSLGKAKLALKVQMALARHTKADLTIGTYTDLEAFDLWGAVESLTHPLTHPKAEAPRKNGPGDSASAGLGASDTSDASNPTFMVDVHGAALLATGTDGQCAPAGAPAPIQNDRPSLQVVSRTGDSIANTAPGHTCRIPSETEHFSPVALSEMSSGKSWQEQTPRHEHCPPYPTPSHNPMARCPMTGW